MLGQIPDLADRLRRQACSAPGEGVDAPNVLLRRRLERHRLRGRLCLLGEAVSLALERLGYHVGSCDDQARSG